MKICYCVVKNNELVEIDQKKVQMATLTALTLATNGPVALAAETTTVGKAFEPIINIITDLADPVAYACFVKSGMLHMIGNEHEGKKAFSNTLKGYLVIKFVPQIMDLLGKVVF